MTDSTELNFRELFKKLQSRIVEEFKVVAKIGVEQEFYLKFNNIDEELLIEELSAGFDLFQKERGWQQFEGIINFTDDLEELAEKVNTARSFVKQKARALGVIFDFAAKPFADDYGSALQLNLSLHDSTKKNIFSHGLIEDNEMLVYSLGGLMDIALESVYLMCEQDEDYERFKIPDFLNPTHLAWGGNNRSAVFRIPQSDPKFRRIEFRVPPAEADIDRAIFVMLLGVYHGLKNQLKPPIRVWGNAFDPVYNLIPLPLSLIAAKSIYDSGGKIAEYISKL
ncbi:MAG: hypothetical protein ACHP6I_02130 [Rickettsiales bacterium]